MTKINAIKAGNQPLNFSKLERKNQNAPLKKQADATSIFPSKQISEQAKTRFNEPKPVQKASRITDILAPAIKSFVDKLSEAAKARAAEKPAESTYEQLERTQIDVIREFERNPEIANDPSKTLFRVTPDGYMDLEGDEKTEVYKESMLALADGMIAKYDANDNCVMDFEEYVTMTVGVQEEISGLHKGEVTPLDFFAQYTTPESLDTAVAGFNMADFDKSGTLDRKEIAAMHAYLDFSQDVYNDNFEKMDSDGTLDGKINLLSSGEEAQEVGLSPEDFFNAFFN